MWADPTAVIGQRLPCRADLLRLVGVVQHQQPPPRPAQLPPNYIGQTRPPSPRGLQLCLGQPTSQCCLHHLLRQLGGIAPAHPKHSPARGVGLRGELRGYRCFAHPASRAQDREPSSWPPQHACQLGQLDFTSAHALHMWGAQGILLAPGRSAHRSQPRRRSCWNIQPSAQQHQPDAGRHQHGEQRPDYPRMSRPSWHGGTGVVGHRPQPRRHDCSRPRHGRPSPRTLPTPHRRHPRSTVISMPKPRPSAQEVERLVVKLVRRPSLTTSTPVPKEPAISY